MSDYRRVTQWIIGMFFSTSGVFLLGWQFLVFLSRCSPFRSPHLLSAMLFMMFYLPSFSSYWFGSECVLDVLFGSSFWPFLSFWVLAFVGFLLYSKDAFSHFIYFFLYLLTSIKLFIQLLACFVCTQLLLLYGRSQRVYSRHFEYVFQESPESIKFISYCFYIFMAYITIDKWGLFIMCI